MIDIATMATQALNMPDGNRYEFFGKTYYGICSTSSTTQVKTVTITGFTSACLVNGVRVVVEFTNPQSYKGTPKLNVSGTGAKDIQYCWGYDANVDEWSTEQIVAFIYNNNKWVIEDGNHASTGYFGKTILSSSYSNASDRAATPSCVNDTINRSLIDFQWDGKEYTSYVLLNSTTPSVWSGEGSNKTVLFDNISFNVITNDNFLNRVVKITYNNIVYYFALPIGYLGTSSGFYMEYDPSYENDLHIEFVYGDNTIKLDAHGSYVGEFGIKVEAYCGSNAGFISYPLLKDTLSNYLTLADLPIYDGTVV